MPILSALDAISPAFARTRLILFSPFRKGRTWKLAATAYFSMFGTLFLPYFLIGLFFIPMAHQAAGASAVAILVSACLGATILYLVIFYLCSRLRFAFFDIVLNRGEFVAPAWRKYGPSSFKWTAFKIVLGTVVLAIIALPLAAWIQHMIPVLASVPAEEGKQINPQMMSILFTFYGAFFLIYFGFGIFYLLSSLLSDFIVPSLALEDTTLAVAFRRFGQLIRREPGQFILYAVLKASLAVGAFMAMYIAFYIVILLFALIFGLIGLLIGLLLQMAHVSAAVLTGLAIFAGVICYIFVFFYVIVIGVGTVLTFLESYTLYFLSGRYPMLGDLLQRSTPPPQPPPPPPFLAYATPPPPPV
jgi:hypothetical protein